MKWRSIAGWTAGLLSSCVVLCAPARAQYGTHYGTQTQVFTGSSNNDFNDMVMDTNGNLYLLDIGAFELDQLTPNGSGGYNMNVIANHLDNGIDEFAYAIDIDSAGNLYLTDNGTVWGFSPNGNGTYTQHTVALSGSGGLSGTFSGVTVDGNGNVYVVGYSSSVVYKLTKTAPWTYTSATLLNGSNGLFDPERIRIDANGALYIVNGDGGLISETYTNGSWVLKYILGNNPSYVDNVVTYPSYVAVDSAGNIYSICGVICEALNINGNYYARQIGTDVGPLVLAGAVPDNNGNVYAFSSEAIYKISYPALSFPNTNIGSTSAALSFPFTVGQSITATAGLALSMDAPGEFTDNGTGTCDTNGPNYSYQYGDTCTINVTFSPKFAGLRRGVVEFVNSEGVMVAEYFVTGTGIGPQLAYEPPTVSTVASFNNPTGVAVDGNGNVFVLDAGAQAILEETPSGANYTQTSPASLQSVNPQAAGLALDAAGNLYYNEATTDTTWYEQLVGTVGYETFIVADGPGGVSMNAPQGVAVDTQGDVVIADTGNNRVIEELYSSGNTYTSGLIGGDWTSNGPVLVLPETVTVASNLKSPQAVAADQQGIIYIADTGNNRVLIEEPSGLYTYTQKVLATSTLNAPGGVAVDNFSNVFISDTGNKRVLMEKLSLGNYTESVLLSTGLSAPGQITVDGGGNIYVVDNGNKNVVKIAFGTAPTLQFDSTPVGQASADSPQTVTVENVGNNPLNFTIPSSGDNPSISTNFTLQSGGSSNCPLIAASASSPGVLDAGGACTLPISFVPTTSGTISGTLTMTDNAGSTAQVIYLNGNGASGSGTVSATLTSPLSFPNTNLGSTSSALDATLTNTGSAALNITSIALGGANPSAYAISSGADGCSTSTPLAVGASCNIYVTFTPTAVAGYSATLVVTDNASPTTQTAALSGAGIQAGATLTPSLGFPNMPAGTTSPVLSAALSNTGSEPLTISSIAIAGTNPGDFAITTGANACSTSIPVPVEASCNVYITFTPAAGQSYSATLTVVDNASPATQTSALTGAGILPPDFAISATPALQTTNPGARASFTVDLSSVNSAFTNAVSLSVAGMPSGATATFTPQSLVPGSQSATSSTLTVQTATALTARTQQSARWPMAALALTLIIPFNKRRRTKWTGVLMLLISAFALLGVMAGCGGGFATKPASQSYTLTITGTAASPESQTTIITHTATVQLAVQGGGL